MDRVYEYFSFVYGHYKRVFIFLSEVAEHTWTWLSDPQNSTTIAYYGWWAVFAVLVSALLWFLITASWRAFWRWWRRPKQRGKRQMSKKAMRAAEKTDVEDLITEAFETAVHKGRIKQEVATAWYIKMGRGLGLKGLVPRALPVRTQLRADREEERLRDPERVAALKANIQHRRDKGNGRVLPLPGDSERRPLKDDLNLKVLSLTAPELKRVARRAKPRAS